MLLYDTLQERLLERIQRLEDDRHSVGLTSGQCSRPRFSGCPQISGQPFAAAARFPHPLSSILGSVSSTLATLAIFLARSGLGNVSASMRDVILSRNSEGNGWARPSRRGDGGGEGVWTKGAVLSGGFKSTGLTFVT